MGSENQSVMVLVPQITMERDKKVNLQDCIKFANENPVCYIATTDGDQPRVRGFLMVIADETGFYFATLSPKEVSKQLKKNPKIEVCYYNNAQNIMDGKMMRVTGKVEFVNEGKIVETALNQRKSLEAIAGKPIDHLLEVFRISTGEAHFWTMMDILKEPELERVKF